MTKTRKRRKSLLTVTQTTYEDDGTQVEREKTRRQRGTRRPSAQADTPEFRKALRDFCLQVNETGVQALAKEFVATRLETQPSQGKSKTAFEANPTKNRYKDVICTDPSRVVLSWPATAENDYIHANWVTAPDISKRFICTQAPTANTVEDFWRMIWQEKCKSIIMLCNITECGKKKCEEYWPDKADTDKEFPACNMKIKHLKAKDLEESISQTTLAVTVTNPENAETFTVEHFQWKDWPDRGVPPTNLSSFRLLMRVRKLAPVVVHCSAGIGRTGAIVGLDMLYSKLEKGEVVTMDSVVRELRKDRHGSVQTDVQYLYMHRILIAVAENKKVITRAEVEKFVADYEDFCRAKGGSG